MSYQKAQPKVAHKFSKGGSGASKRQLNRIYKKNTGQSTKGRNARLSRHK